jgi:hypothetical protein
MTGLAYLEFRWLSSSPVNVSTWVALVVSFALPDSVSPNSTCPSPKDAELAALLGFSDAFKLYDMAVKLVV